MHDFVIAAVFWFLTSLPAAWTDRSEPPGDRLERLETVAVAITDAAELHASCVGADCTPAWGGSTAELAFALAELGFQESRFERRVHAGRCGPRQCDAVHLWRGGRLVVVHLARSPWQIQRTSLVHDNEWRGMVGTDVESTRHAAIVAARILSRARRACGASNHEGWFTYYATGGRCQSRTWGQHARSRAASLRYHYWKHWTRCTSHHPAAAACGWISR